MSLLARSELKKLIESDGPWRVSIYMPTHRAGARVKEDPIRLKNLLNEAEERLTAGGLRSSAARGLLGPGRKLLTDRAFWQQQGDGLAGLLAPEMSRFYRLPLSFDSLVVAGPRFHIKPLLPLVVAAADFYVLALSQDQARLLYGTQYTISEVDVEAMPKGLSDALKYDDPERQLQFHTGTSAAAAPAGATRAAIYHGHGAGANDAKPNLLRYFREVSASLHSVLRDEQAPMVLAGVDYLLPLYREANTYPHLADVEILGNPEGLSPEALRKRAWELLIPHFEADREQAVARYRQLAGSGSDLASQDLQRVLPAAHGGRVGSLFLSRGVQRWGVYDPATGSIEIREEPEPGDVDLLDVAAAYTFINRGDVHLLERDKMPGEATLAAEFRF